VKFAKIVFWIAAIWGVAVLVPHYFMLDMIGRNDPPPITHPEFFYGFVGVALAFQLVFVVIAGDPVRHRPLMIPSMFEKFSFVATMVIMVMRGSIHSVSLVVAAPDALLGIMFVIAYFKTASQG